MRPLRKITVVITGASSGIGRATASAFAMPGVRLVLAARGREALDIVARECEARGARVLVVPTDVTDANQVRQLAREAADSGDGRIDVWVNNAGIGAIGLIEQVPAHAHEKVLQTNLLGYLYGAQAVLPYFKQMRQGTLINVLSLNAWAPIAYAASYNASKYGLRGLSEAIRTELTDWPGIHVCDIFPTVIDTPAFRHSANFTGKQVRPPKPLYDARTVARAIVRAAANPRRQSTIIGWPTWLARFGHFVAPGLARRFAWGLTHTYFAQADEAPVSEGNLHQPSRGMMTVDGAWKTEPPRAHRTAGLVGLGLAAVATLAALALTRDDRLR